MVKEWICFIDRNTMLANALDTEYERKRRMKDDSPDLLELLERQS